MYLNVIDCRSAENYLIFFIGFRVGMTITILCRYILNQNYTSKYNQSEFRLNQ